MKRIKHFETSTLLPSDPNGINRQLRNPSEIFIMADAYLFKISFLQKPFRSFVNEMGMKDGECYKRRIKNDNNFIQVTENLHL